MWLQQWRGRPLQPLLTAINQCAALGDAAVVPRRLRAGAQQSFRGGGALAGSVVLAVWLIAFKQWRGYSFSSGEGGLGSLSSPRSLMGLSGPRSVAFEGGGALAGRCRGVVNGFQAVVVWLQQPRGRPQRPLLAALIWEGCPVIAQWQLTAPSAAVADGAERVSVVGSGALPSALGTAPEVRVRVVPLVAVQAAMQASVAAVAGSVRTPVWGVLLWSTGWRCTSASSLCAACVGWPVTPRVRMPCVHVAPSVAVGVRHARVVCSVVVCCWESARLSRESRRGDRHPPLCFRAPT